MDKTQYLDNAIKQLILIGEVQSQTDFAEKIGKAKSQVTDMLKGRISISAKSVNQICTAFPSLNPEYLLTGTGSILKGRNDVQQLDMTPTYLAQIQLLKDQVAFLEKQLEQMNATNQQLTALLMKDK